MSMSIDVEAPSMFEDPYGLKSRRKCRSWHAWALAIIVATVLIVTNSLVLKAVNRIKVDYAQSLLRFDDRLDKIEPFYRWPIPEDQVLHYECLYPVGGGTLSHGGNFPQSRLHDSKQCKGVLDWYFAPGSGEYWKDLDEIRDAAIEYLTAKETFKKGDSTNMVIFDIDETVLSNLKSIQARNYAPRPENQTHVHDELEMAPAIEAIKDVYLAAYQHGMSTAFITGRTEASRDYTERNLKQVGLGEKCAQDGNGNVIRTSNKPCYMALHLRDLKADLNKLASVYKPERRKQLIDAGFRMVATFGDQFSDSSGSFSALAAFKMPNPMYYIL